MIINLLSAHTQQIQAKNCSYASKIFHSFYSPISKRKGVNRKETQKEIMKITRLKNEFRVGSDRKKIKKRGDSNNETWNKLNFVELCENKLMHIHELWNSKVFFYGSSVLQKRRRRIHVEL